MLADHVEQTTRRNSEFLALHTDSHDFLVVLRAVDRSAQDGSGSSPLLLELHLHGTRVSGHGGEVTEFLDPRWRIITHVIEGAGLAETASVRLDPEPLATAPLAARNRFGLHQLMDAKRWPPDSPSIHHFS